MKDTHFLYGVAILAVVGIIAVFVAYATDTLPTYTPKTVPMSTTQLTREKKGCGCCSEKRDEALKKIEKQIKANKDIGDIWNELVNDF